MFFEKKIDVQGTDQSPNLICYYVWSVVYLIFGNHNK